VSDVLRPDSKKLFAAIVCVACIAIAAAAAASSPKPLAEVSRKILSNGTIEIRYSNGTIKQIPPGTTTGRTSDANPAPLATSTDMALPSAPEIGAISGAIKSKYDIALTAYYDYRISGYKHREEVFGWQFLSSKIIFWVVLFIVLSGMLFSAIQFFRTSPSKSEITEVEASVSGIRVSSPVLGVIILTISIAFFYLYLVFVYPINNVF
jgi:hypothetical protein